MKQKIKIITNPDVMLGKPVIEGTRITAELILRKFSEGAKMTDILNMYPHLTELHVKAVFEYAKVT